MVSEIGNPKSPIENPKDEAVLFFEIGNPKSPIENPKGRWLSPDPLAGDITNPQSLNRYAYVLNNPTNLIDPLGLDAYVPGPACFYQDPASCEEYYATFYGMSDNAVAEGWYAGGALLTFLNGCLAGGACGTSVLSFGGVRYTWVPPAQEQMALTFLDDAGNPTGTAGWTGNLMRGYWSVSSDVIGGSFNEFAGDASFYPRTGNPTATREVYNPNAMTAAMRNDTVPQLGVRVTVNYNGKSVVVRVNDRGPYAKGRLIDLTPAAFSALVGSLRLGVVPVTVYVPTAPPLGG